MTLAPYDVLLSLLVQPSHLLPPHPSPLFWIPLQPASSSSSSLSTYLSPSLPTTSINQWTLYPPLLPISSSSSPPPHLSIGGKFDSHQQQSLLTSLLSPSSPLTYFTFSTPHLSAPWSTKVNKKVNASQQNVNGSQRKSNKVKQSQRDEDHTSLTLLINYIIKDLFFILTFPQMIIMFYV